MVIRCPRCKVPLTKVEYQPGTEVYWCSLCSGIWVDGEELYEILQISPDAIPVAVRKDNKVCPKCGSSLFYPVDFQDTGIVIDICERCKGIWFDRGEIQAMKKVLQEDTEEPADKKPASEKIANWVNNVIEYIKYA
jgi:uncharacterized protein